MKKLVLFIGVFSLLMLIDTETSKSIELVMTNFFHDVNEITDSANESELEELNTYFTIDCPIQDALIDYLIEIPLANENQMVNYAIKGMEIDKQRGLYRVLIEVDLHSKETNEFLYSTSMYLYLTEENGQMKIESGDFGG